MRKIGMMGTTTIGKLVLSTLDMSKYEYVDMDYTGHLARINKVSVLVRLAHYLKMLGGVDAVMFVYPERRCTNIAMKLARARGKKTILYWIGSDVYERLRGEAPMPEEKHIDLHLAVGRRLVDELGQLGACAKSLYAPSDLPQEIAPMPSEHAVLVNIPDHRSSFYGYETIIRLIRDFPHLKFIVVRSETPGRYNYANVDFRGILSREQMDKAFADTSICIRFPEHDSVGLTVIEAMIKGKEVICNYPVPYTHEAHSYRELYDALTAIITKPVKQNIDAHAFATREFGREKCAEDFSRYLEELFE